jgi:hypothetical protein
MGTQFCDELGAIHALASARLLTSALNRCFELFTLVGLHLASEHVLDDLELDLSAVGQIGRLVEQESPLVNAGPNDHPSIVASRILGAIPS